MARGEELGRELDRAALVAFSGGQDSTTALTWALSSFERVETVGFRYGQKHLVELRQRPIIREAIAGLSADWKRRLGPDHVVDLDLIGQIAGKGIASRPGHNLIVGDGFQTGTRYIPGRNLIFLSMSASVAFRRDIRTLVCGASETEYSGYPDCQDASMRAVEIAINTCSGFEFKIECPLMFLDKAGVWKLAFSLGGNDLVKIVEEDTHTCYLGSRAFRHEWGYGCESCEACRLRAKGWREFRAQLQS